KCAQRCGVGHLVAEHPRVTCGDAPFFAAFQAQHAVGTCGGLGNGGGSGHGSGGIGEGAGSIQAANARARYASDLDWGPAAGGPEDWPCRRPGPVVRMASSGRGGGSIRFRGRPCIRGPVPGSVKRSVMQIRHVNADGSPRYTNRLDAESSPYLRQHGHNPVDWYPWGRGGVRPRARSRPSGA
ncbi:protein containing DUF255, partial [mine drainage metagenome]